MKCVRCVCVCVRQWHHNEKFKANFKSPNFFNLSALGTWHSGHHNHEQLSEEDIQVHYSRVLTLSLVFILAFMLFWLKSRINNSLNKYQMRWFENKFLISVWRGARRICMWYLGKGYCIWNHYDNQITQLTLFTNCNFQSLYSLWGLFGPCTTKLNYIQL